MSKRYVLFLAESALTERDMTELASAAKGAYGAVKLIPVEGNPRAVILKTSDAVARVLRRAGNDGWGAGLLTPVLTSGSIGKLKSRATETGSTRHGKVPK